MHFENPTYLWSLFGVLIPIGIHLWSRREARTIRVGSIELLEASETARSRAIRPNEWWLLALRILIVALLALVLSGPRVWLPSPRQGLVYIIDPSLIQDGAPIDLSGLPGRASQVRLLQKGLPVWDPDDAPTVSEASPGYWQLVPELNALPADSVVVYTRGHVNGTRSKRIPSASHIHWVVVPNRDQLAQSLLGRGDSDTLALYTMRSGPDQTTFESRRIPASEGAYSISKGLDSIRLGAGNEVSQVPFQSTEALQAGLYAQPGFEAESAYLEAALGAVSKYLGQEVRVKKGPADAKVMADHPDLLIWLSGDPPPQTDGNVLYFRPDSLAADPIGPDGKKGRYRLTQRPNLENTVSGHLPERLLQLLINPSQWDEAIRKADRRQWEAGMLGVPGRGAPDRAGRNKTANRKGKNITTGSRDLSRYFWIAILALLSGERLLALIRKQ